MSLWLGGLAILAACVLSTVPGDAEVVAVTRFSRLAFGCVVVLVATGAFQVWREVGALHEFVSTTYGRLLLVKLGAFVVLVALPSVSRNLVQRRVRVATTVAQADRIDSGRRWRERQERRGRGESRDPRRDGPRTRDQ